MLGRWLWNVQSSEELGVHIRIQAPHLMAMVQLKTDRLWMVSGESGGLCEAVPTERITMVNNCDWECWERQEVQEERQHWSSMLHWFLVMGEETVLQDLEQECVSIEKSTSWKLECCYQPVSASATHDLGCEGGIAHTPMHHAINQPRGWWEFFSVSSITACKFSHAG